jgi:hypothetical protein
MTLGTRLVLCLGRTIPAHAVSNGRHRLLATALPRSTIATHNHQGKWPRPKAESQVLTAIGGIISEVVTIPTSLHKHCAYETDSNAVPKSDIYISHPMVTY